MCQNVSEEHIRFYIYTTLDGISLDISIPPCIHINPNGYPSSLSPLIRSQMDESCTTIISPLYNRWCTITIMKKDFNVLPNICSLIHSIYHFHPLPSTHFQACGVGPHAPATQNKRLVVSLNKLWIYWDQTGFDGIYWDIVGYEWEMNYRIMSYLSLREWWIYQQSEKIYMYTIYIYIYIHIYTILYYNHNVTINQRDKNRGSQWPHNCPFLRRIHCGDQSSRFAAQSRC